MTTNHLRGNQINRFRIARDKGGKYLSKFLHSDGSFGDPYIGAAEYYKAPAALMASGETESANRLLSWIRKYGITEEGDFGPRHPAEKNTYYYAYYNTWIIIASQRMRQFDLSRRGMDFLLNFRDPETGGFYSSLIERKPSTLQDIWVVSGCGIAALSTGMIDIAKGVGYWLNNILSIQPDYPKKLYTVYSRSNGLYTPTNSQDPFRHVLDTELEKDQSFFHPGIAGGFLALLYQATGENKWIELSKEYMLLAETANPYLWRLLRAGKIGWCASVLYTLTGEKIYKDMAIKVGNNLISAQSEEGYWKADGSDNPSNDITAEMVVWLDEIYQSIGSL